MNIKTGRFGELSIEREDRIDIPQGILGFPDYRQFCLIDPSDDTLIMWLQSLDNPDIVFPVLEPKVFKADYKVGLSAADQREPPFFSRECGRPAQQQGREYTTNHGSRGMFRER